MMDRNLAWGINALHQALSTRSQKTGEARSIPGENTSLCEPSGGTIGQESDEELTPREEALNRFHESREWNSRG